MQIIVLERLSAWLHAITVHTHSKERSTTEHANSDNNETEVSTVFLFLFQRPY